MTILNNYNSTAFMSRPFQQIKYCSKQLNQDLINQIFTKSIWYFCECGN